MNQMLRIPGLLPETPAAAAGLGPLGCCGQPRVTQESGAFLEARAHGLWTLGLDVLLYSFLWRRQTGVESDLLCFWSDRSCLDSFSHL